jgi:hypothetical protein
MKSAVDIPLLHIHQTDSMDLFLSALGWLSSSSSNSAVFQKNQASLSAIHFTLKGPDQITNIQ